MGVPVCYDNTNAPIVGACCGIGACNLACCNCDNGCKGNSNMPYDYGFFGPISPNIGFKNPFSLPASSGKDIVQEAAKKIAGTIWDNKKLITEIKQQ